MVIILKANKPKKTKRCTRTFVRVWSFCLFLYSQTESRKHNEKENSGLQVAGDRYNVYRRNHNGSNLTMYYSHYVQVESKINDFNQSIEQLQESQSGKTDSGSNRQPENMDKYKTDYDTDTREHSRSDGVTSSRSNGYINIEALKKDSLAYNEALKQNQNLRLKGDNYIYSALDLTKYGIYDNIYGYVSAPSIGMELPIYLGANDDTMGFGAGHLCYTSLPTGGTDTNVVLAGHTGYIGRWLFDSVSSLSVGDEVSVTTYFGKLDYKVTRVLNRAPNDSDILFIEKGKDKLTLITCIDGGSARRVVVCER